MWKVQLHNDLLQIDGDPHQGDRDLLQEVEALNKLHLMQIVLTRPLTKDEYLILLFFV